MRTLHSRPCPASPHPPIDSRPRRSWPSAEERFREWVRALSPDLDPGGSLGLARVGGRSGDRHRRRFAPVSEQSQPAIYEGQAGTATSSRVIVAAAGVTFKALTATTSQATFAANFAESKCSGAECFRTVWTISMVGGPRWVLSLTSCRLPRGRCDQEGGERQVPKGCLPLLPGRVEVRNFNWEALQVNTLLSPTIRSSPLLLRPIHRIAADAERRGRPVT